MPDLTTFIALNRFGLGARPGDFARVGGDPRGWLDAQLSGVAPPAALADLPPSSQGYVRKMQGVRQARAKSTEVAKPDAPDMAAEAAMTDARTMTRREPPIYRTEVAARMTAQVASDTPYRERLIAFWSNHFTVSARNGLLRNLVGAFEREAIRPDVTGRFVDMVAATVRHPAMLIYLNNARSFGPRSPEGKRRRRGLNENHARELLELHTLGVDGGYDQDDVIALARILTGWTVGRADGDDPGRFRFREGAHEPGAKTLLGRRYPEAGIGEGEAAIAALAEHPSTATHIATKLCRHFLADGPPPDAVARIAGVFRKTGGDLAAVSRALVREPAAWREPLAKFKAPREFVVSAARAIGPGLDVTWLVRAVDMLGQPAFLAPSPAGWPDTAAKWISPEATLRRIEWADETGRRLGRRGNPKRLFDTTIAPVAAPRTAAIIEGAPSPAAAVGLILASAEFQRR